MSKRIVISIRRISALALLLSVITIGTAYLYRHKIAGLGYELLIEASKNDNYSLAQMLLIVGAPPSPYKEMQEYSYYNSETFTPPLQYAVKSGNFNLAKSLVERGAEIDWCCCECTTALHLAIIANNPEIVRFLLEAGADVVKKYEFEYSVLDLAKRKSSQDIVDILKEHIDKKVPSSNN